MIMAEFAPAETDRWSDVATDVATDDEKPAAAPEPAPEPVAPATDDETPEPAPEPAAPDEDAEPLELVIVGAGPQALALLLRLLDDAPDESGDFFVGLGSAPRAARKTQASLARPRCSRAAAAALLARVRVVDAGGRWLGRWDDQFRALEIPHLRSTYDQTPCPYDSFALQQYVMKTGRERDVVDLDASIKNTQEGGGDGGCDCEHAKGKGCGFKGNFRLPSTKLFRDFCAHLMDQYPGVRDCCTKGEVARVERLGADLARVVLKRGAPLVARRVVLALGPSAAPRLPDWAATCPGALSAWDVVAAAARGGAVCDAGDRVGVVGGGLTSAHLCFVAERLGASCTLLTRRASLRVRQYDLDLPWLGWRTRPGRIAKYLSRRAAPEDRLAMLKDARRGGSVSPEAKRLLDASPTPVISAEIVDAEVEGGRAFLDAAGGERLGPFDRVWLATGGAVGVRGSPVLEGLLEAVPVPLVGDYPVLHASLRWEVDTPIYVVGAAAALLLGPDALNLAGSRMSSCRVASVFRETLRKRCAGELSAEEAAAIERSRARRLEELAVDYVPKKGTVVVKGRPGDAALGTRREKVQGDGAKPRRKKGSRG